MRSEVEKYSTLPAHLQRSEDLLLAESISLEKVDIQQCSECQRATADLHQKCLDNDLAQLQVYYYIFFYLKILKIMVLLYSNQ